MTGQGRALSSLAVLLGRHTATYAAAALVTFFISVVNVVVLTRLLPVSAFGRLAVLLFFAALLTVAYNLGTLQGTFLRAFGASGEEETGADDADEHVAADKRRALGSSLVLTTLLVASGTIAIAAVAPTLAALPLGLSASASAIRWAAVCGALGALWRLLVNVPRYERRAGLFFALSVVRPLAVVAGSVTLVAIEPSVERALIGTALGALVANIVALLLTRRSYRLALDRSDISVITRRGAFFVPLIVAFWVIQNVDLYLVSLFSSDADVARYRIASRIAAGLSYFVSAFLMAWVPLTRTPLYEAVIRERGLSDATATILTHFLVICIWVLLALSVFADLLIRLAPATYSDAAPLIPLVGAAFIAYGLFVVVYRGSELGGKRKLYLRLSLFAALVFATLGIAFTALLGAYGPPVAQIVSFALATAWLLGATRRGGQPVPLQAGALVRSVILGGVLVAVGLAVSARLDTGRVFVDAALLFVFPIALFAIGVLRPRDIGELRSRGRSWIRRDQRSSTAQRLEALSPDDRHLMDLLFRRKLSPSEVAVAKGTDEKETLEHVAATLREIAGRPGASSDEPGLARWLLSKEVVAEQDAGARQLLQRGVEPMDLEILSRSVRQLRRLPNDQLVRALRAKGHELEPVTHAQAE